MNKYDFVARAVGLPWVDRACSWQAMDCWGVAIMYFRHVYGEELPCVEGYSTRQITIADGFHQQIAGGTWNRVDQPEGDGIAFMLFNGGEATHVGVVIDGTHVLHSAGNDNSPGQVRCDRIDAFRRFHGGDMHFFKYEGWRCW